MYKYKRKYITKEVVYVLILLIVSLTGNVYQSHCLNEVVAIDNQSYMLLRSDYNKLEENNRELQQKYDILLDEYNELLND